jgi:hypothetical protein
MKLIAANHTPGSRTWTVTFLIPVTVTFPTPGPGAAKGPPRIRGGQVLSAAYALRFTRSLGLQFSQASV